MYKPWISCAEWPESVYTDTDGTHVSKDGHDAEDAARAVCGRLEREGFGGDRQDFPVKTWVEAENPHQVWQVRGDHPIYRRPDRQFRGPARETQTAAAEYARGLRGKGFENITCEEVV